jgi:hypothetical protein
MKYSSSLALNMCTSLLQLVTPLSTLHVAMAYITLLASHVHIFIYKTKHVERKGTPSFCIRSILHMIAVDF